MKIQPQGPAIHVENLGKRFQIGVKQGKESFLGTTRRLINGSNTQRELWALRHISFKVERGETLGVIGPNGAGKSTLLLLLSQILSPTEGECRVDSKTHCFFRIGAALQPRLTVLENFSLCCSLLGLDRSEFKKRLPAMIEFSGLEDYLYAKYGELSSGLAARLPFAAAVFTDLHTILVDEMLMVGDRTFQTKCLKTFHDFKAQGKTLVIVSHSLPLISSLCARTLYLNAGKMVYLGDSATAVNMLINDMGGALPRDQRAPAAAPAPREAALSHTQIKKIAAAAAQRVRLELAALTEDRRNAVSREFTAGDGSEGFPDRPSRELIDAEVRKLGPALRKSAEEALAAAGPRPPQPEQPSLQVQIQKSVESELSRMRQEVQAAMEESRRAGERDREAWLNSARETVRISQKATRAAPRGLGQEASPEVGLAWKEFLGHKGPLAVCSSVQGAFGTALQGLMAWPGDRGAKPGDEVILTSVVWPWVLQGLRSYGLVPVFVDLDPETFCLDPKQLSQALSDKTRAVFLSYNGNTCPDVTAVAGFCAKHDLRLIEGVCSSALGGKYDDKFMGTRGDFSVYFPKKPYSTWSLVLSRHEEMTDLFSRILTGEGHDEELNLHHGAPGEAFQPDARFFHPSRAYGMGLSNAFKACGKWKAPISKLHGDFDAYADFFGAYSQYFAIPQPPAQARLGGQFFVLVARKDGPFKAQDLLDAKLDCAAQRAIMGGYTRQYPEEHTPFRQVNELPVTGELMERGVIFPVLHDPAVRKVFFDAFRHWIKKKG